MKREMACWPVVQDLKETGGRFLTSGNCGSLDIQSTLTTTLHYVISLTYKGEENGRTMATQLKQRYKSKISTLGNGEGTAGDTSISASRSMIQR